MFVLAETMHLCRTLGELLTMHSGCFCYRSNNVWFWKEQSLVSFAEMTCQKCKKKWQSQHLLLPFFQCIQSSFNMCMMILNLWHSHSLPLSRFLPGHHPNPEEISEKARAPSPFGATLEWMRFPLHKGTKFRWIGRSTRATRGTQPSRKACFWWATPGEKSVRRWKSLRRTVSGEHRKETKNGLWWKMEKACQFLTGTTMWPASSWQRKMGWRVTWQWFQRSFVSTHDLDLKFAENWGDLQELTIHTIPKTAKHLGKLIPGRPAYLFYCFRHVSTKSQSTWDQHGPAMCAGQSNVRLNMQMKDFAQDAALLSLACRPKQHINFQMAMQQRQREKRGGSIFGIRTVIG